MKKSELKLKCKEILSRYKPGELINTDDFLFLMDIFLLHPEWELKKGVGVSRISIMQTKYKTKCFCIHRTNNSITDISYIQCLDGRNSELKDIHAACRDAIQDIVSYFKRKNVVYGITVCPFTNEMLYEGNCHIDHYDLQFNHLVTAWLKYKDIYFIHSFINNGKIDLETGVFFLRDDIRRDFISFHNNNTNLRAVSSFANLSILK